MRDADDGAARERLPRRSMDRGLVRASPREDLDAAYEAYVLSRGGVRSIRKVLIANNGCA
jgi:hypothetical protein